MLSRKEKVQFLIENIKGVGPAKAEKIADLFPNVEKFTSISYDTETYNKLITVVSRSLAESIVDQLKEIQRQDNEVQLMVECGIPYFSAVNLLKTELQYEAFLKNPYKIGKNNGLDFKNCDRFAHIIFGDNNPDMSETRMHWLIDYTLMTLENSGHTFAYLTQLTNKINAYQKKNIYLPDWYEESTILLYLLNNPFVEIEKDKDINKWKIYRKDTYNLENDIAYHIKRLAINKRTKNDVEFKSAGLKYDEIQMGAIKSAVMSGLKIITGPPGSGKTAVINGVISYFKQMNPSAEIILCAPTGRAAKHMTEITGRPSSTIHKLLKICENDNFVTKQTLECDMIICDEASMLNLDITYQLLASIKTGSVVYFVGDKDQLPAVGPGNVLHDIINSGVVPVYHLTKVYRQDGIILENAHEINRGVVPENQSELYQTTAYTDPVELKNQAIDTFQKLYDINDPFETQILVPSYKTECGIIALNQAIQELNEEPYIYRAKTIGEYSYKRNDKILMTKNDKGGQYQNGSVGIFLANMNDELLVEFDGNEVVLEKEAIDDMSLGYAISVHKSQGSEYKHVILCLPDKPENMLKKNIVYTAVTRAKHDISIFEMSGAMKKAVKTNNELYMQTGLKEKLITKHKV